MVGERHDTGDLSDGQVSDRAVVQANDAFAARHAVDPCLDCFRRTVEIIGGMPRILMRPRPADVV